MNIIIRDDQGLDTPLMMDGYSMEERQENKNKPIRRMPDEYINS